MKIVLLATLVSLFVSPVMAGHHEGGHGMDMGKRKEMRMAHIDKRIASLQTLKTCVSGITATKKDEFRAANKACSKENKDRMAALKEERKKMKGMHKNK